MHNGLKYFLEEFEDFCSNTSKKVQIIKEMFRKNKDA